VRREKTPAEASPAEPAATEPKAVQCYACAARETLRELVRKAGLAPDGQEYSGFAEWVTDSAEDGPTLVVGLFNRGSAVGLLLIPESHWEWFAGAAGRARETLGQLWGVEQAES
jgi:hypothetical protein